MKQFPEDLKLLLDPSPSGHKTGISGAEDKAEKIAQKPGVLCGKSGNYIEAEKLDRVNHTPTSYSNIFSGTNVLKKGWTIQGENNTIELIKVNRKIVFDINITTTKGVIFAMYHCCSNYIYGAATYVGTKMLLTKAHILISHGNEYQTHNTAKELGWMLTHGGMPPCSVCAQAKENQKKSQKRVIM